MSSPPSTLAPDPKPQLPKCLEVRHLNLGRFAPDGAEALGLMTMAEPPSIPLPGLAGNPKAAQPGVVACRAADSTEDPLPSSLRLHSS